MGPYSTGAQLSPFSSPQVPPPSQQPPVRTMAPTAPAAAAPPPPSQTHLGPLLQSSPTKDASPSVLCRMGQELVQEIVTRTIELLTFYSRSLQQLKPGSNPDRKTKLEELIRIIEMNFQKLRKVYDAINEMMTDVQLRPVEDFLPIVDIDGTEEDQTATEIVKPISEEQKELIEQIRAKNCYLKEIIDHQRVIIWEINTMLAMRKTMP